MMRLLNTYKTFDVVLVPFPFTTDPRAKKRPALVLSSHTFFNNFIDHTICAMITSSSHLEWPFDVEIKDLSSCGLEKASVIRFKIFTIDNRLISTSIGTLSLADQKRIQTSVQAVFKEMLRDISNVIRNHSPLDQITL